MPIKKRDLQWVCEYHKEIIHIIEERIQLQRDIKKLIWKCLKKFLQKNTETPTKYLDDNEDGDDFPNSELLLWSIKHNDPKWLDFLANFYIGSCNKSKLDTTLWQSIHNIM